MKPLKFIPLLLSLSLLAACGSTATPKSDEGDVKPLTTTTTVAPENIKGIYLAGGCFWGTEHFMSKIQGVVDVTVGYANGTTENPTYQDVITGTTGHAETVYVTYDKTEVDLNFLLPLFYETINPVSVNKQGNDVGSQYRTGVYYSDEADLEVIQQTLATLAKEFDVPLAVEALPIDSYTVAEDYHQDYLIKNPNGYCHIPSALFDKADAAVPDPLDLEDLLNPYEPMDDEALRETLTTEQYEVTQNAATERAFTNEYWDEYDAGIYVDITSGEPLFLSSDKFSSGTGWPSFSKPIATDVINEFEDNSFWSKRTEVKSALSDSHLGHVFNDGPADMGGLRYCINSASLTFVAKADMEAEGYGELLYLLDE